MTGRSRGEARPRYQRPARRAHAGDDSLAQAVRACICVALLVLACFGSVWGVSAVYQSGYVDGYGDAKAAYHG